MYVCMYVCVCIYIYIVIVKSFQNASGLYLMHQAICKSNQGIHSASFACKIFQITAMIIIPQSLGVLLYL